MGLFSKNKNKYDEEFFQSLEEDVQKSREQEFLKLSDFSKNDTDKIESLKETFNIGNEELNDNTKNESISPLDSIINKVSKKAESYVAEKTVEETEETVTVSETIPQTESKVETLLEKCKAYTRDENGTDVSENEKPLYELKSVADILKNTSLGALDSLSKKYNIEILDETQKTEKYSEIIKESEKPIDVTEKNQEKTEETSDSNPIVFSELVEKSKNTQKSQDEVLEDFLIQNNPDIKVEVSDKTLPDISDVDNKQKLESETSESVDNIQSTLKFTPLKDKGKNKSKMTVANITSTFDFKKIIDFNSDVDENSSTSNELEENEFDDFVCKNEVKNFDDIKHLIKKLSIKKRNSFLLSVISFLSAFGVSLFLFNPLKEYLVSDCEKSIISCTIMFIINLIVNIEIFTKSIKYFGKFSTYDLSALICSVYTLVLAFFQIKSHSLEYSFNVYHIILISSVILFLRSLMEFKRISAKLGNLKQISSEKSKKYAVSFIDNPSVTFAMAKNSVEGDILLAAPRKCNFIDDFVKYNEYNMLFGGKFYILQIIAVLLSVISFLIASVYYKNTIASLYCASAVVCIFSLPCLYFINVLPLFYSSKRLNPIGAMISGNAGANKINKSNCVTVSTSEVFPENTIVLKDLKILSEGNIDDIILRAASLTKSVDSPLYPIFKKIAKTNSSYVLPDSDTVKYEERLGLSGWVDNELLFIGNRSLMVSHGIDVPSLEVDKKILNNGCFPVYLATSDTACALLIIEYNPSYSISKQLRKIIKLGVTVLFTNNDPNINEEMLADYFGIYEDCIKIVSNVGNNMYRNAISPVYSYSSPASFKRNNLAFLKIMNSASSVKKSNTFFSVIYLVFSILMSASFIYLAFASKTSVPSSLYLLVSEFGITVLSYIIFLFYKP